MSSSLSARERIESLLDENSFVEIGARVRARSTDFSLKPTEAPSRRCHYRLWLDRRQTCLCI